jgi:hypothetical protein
MFRNFSSEIFDLILNKWTFIYRLHAIVSEWKMRGNNMNDNGETHRDWSINFVSLLKNLHLYFDGKHYGLQLKASLVCHTHMEQ